MIEIQETDLPKIDLKTKEYTDDHCKVGELLSLTRLDSYTRVHQIRVGKLAYNITREMGWSEEEAKLVRVAGMIHDMGKVYIPKYLRWKTPLNGAEYEVFQQHPLWGYKLLMVMNFTNEVIADVALKHHERMNGSGYPFHLEGGDIDPVTRVVAVADVIDAIRYSRPYRLALGLQKAMDEIATNKGILYDCEVVEACLNFFNGKAGVTTKKVF